MRVHACTYMRIHARTCITCIYSHAHTAGMVHPRRGLVAPLPSRLGARMHVSTCTRMRAHASTNGITEEREMNISLSSQAWFGASWPFSHAEVHTCPCVGVPDRVRPRACVNACANACTRVCVCGLACACACVGACMRACTREASPHSQGARKRSPGHPALPPTHRHSHAQISTTTRMCARKFAYAHARMCAN